MLNTVNGELKINDELIVHPEYQFDEFKNTEYYDGQDGIKIIYLEKIQKIDTYHYFVNLFFKEKQLYSVSLINCDQNISESNEIDRKTIHDKILSENGIQNNVSYNWGKIISEYDPRSNISSIDIFYNIR
ncbi:hypothetical protein ACEXFN_003008 [Listeria monocytogenes]|uniref:Uncharacterized protein n=7 Tax=Listeria monocytogenes TaxID=1639 RepID=A0A628TM14_LISMN|nr:MULTISPECIES: hypothetical protein [Listeria]EAD5052642.1 hypothetical protein [Listeria monocytogenes serotype 4b]EAG6254554.1 hypothetical protein [Listeria monocytogenes CFSAN003806]EAG6263348.1 hypothetical protein [Listeria monocytogenes CFSAN003725]EAG6333645.1 hypothetical protein [Listeria monocytogenes CFSAN002346]EAG6351688.1 hypothetical protein [Listeria monocytogenes LIS0102]EGC3055227.1 hypothetical protein [Listeria monocytogenes CFSAN002357]EHC5221676.1 hypothetical protei